MWMPLFQPHLSPQEETSIPTGICMTYFDVCAWTMFIHVQTCLLSDVITSGNIELLFCSHNTIDLRRGQQERFGALRQAGDIQIPSALER
jgi:hypothetical protein